MVRCLKYQNRDYYESVFYGTEASSLKKTFVIWDRGGVIFGKQAGIAAAGAVLGQGGQFVRQHGWFWVSGLILGQQLQFLGSGYGFRAARRFSGSGRDFRAAGAVFG